MHATGPARWERLGRAGRPVKAGPPEELFRAVRTAAAGGMALAPEAAAGVAGHAVERPGPVLSKREIEVVRLLTEGHSNRAIASTPFLAEAPVKTHPVPNYASSARRTGRRRSARPSGGGDRVRLNRRGGGGPTVRAPPLPRPGRTSTQAHRP
ncbi:LuxR C-terminal-related transcriptional regulator [Streptomyces viridochromogenes]|uniref:LuxR C-terminal-related transcriptional regulator n=1 Tax=Streptomyces viridochromogenes TaxID=1938 RepID=UPI000A8A4580|nr:LuxR C-terminal-related transcriptional regulator [Streptomyces viridochromogenes]